MQVDVQFKTGRTQILPNGMTVCEITVPELKAVQYLFLPFDDFHRYFGAPEGVAGDLLVVAGSCYVIDQLIPRTTSSDQWTRKLEVNLPVAQPHRWNDINVDLSETLTFLTGDLWRISFHQRHVQIYRHRHRRLRRRRLHPATTVCLFSGGLDSLGGAIDLLSDTKEPVTLVGHYDLGSMAKRVQSKLTDALAKEFPWRCNLIQARVGPLQKVISSSGVHGQVSTPRNRESTLRSRSLVFLALGLYVAQGHGRGGAVPLLMPENGFIALNPPLTDSRLGSCSTRTAHPLFLARFEEIVQRLGIANRIRNPLAEKTKGETLSSSRNLDLLKRLTPNTVSCAHPTRRQGWIRRSTTHCGYCIPCICRRAALHRIGLDEGEAYGIDICAGEMPLHEDVASDLRAVLSFIYSAQVGDFVPEVVANQMPLPPGVHPVAVRILTAGIDELVQLFRDKAIPQVQAWGGMV